MTDRKTLPYRKNCEGYFLYRSLYVLARKSNFGHIVFPGGGIDKGETPLDAIKRETMEETGASLNNIEEIAMMHFDWGKDWAQSEKQKQRYQKYRGEEMHFFTGRVEALSEPKGDESDAWIDKKFMSIEEAIDILEGQKPFDEEIREYRERQIKNLRALSQK